MTSTAQHQPYQGPSSSLAAKLTKGGFGFKTGGDPRRKDAYGGDGRRKDGGGIRDEDEWYIPYNGPYEAPRPPSPRRQRARDSWGDPLDDYDYTRASTSNSIIHSQIDTEEDDDAGDIARRMADLDDARYGYARGHGLGHTRGDSALSGTESAATTSSRYMSDRDTDPDRTLTLRGRNMQRGRAGSTASSGAQDPSSRGGVFAPARGAQTQRRSTVSAAHLSLSAVGGGGGFAALGGGGVGESPVPARRLGAGTGGGDGNRISFASIFSGFSGIGGLAGSSSGKTHRRGESGSSVGNSKAQWASPVRSITPASPSPYVMKMPASPQDSLRHPAPTSSSNLKRASSRHATRTETETLTINSRTVHDAVQTRIDSLATDDEEYYNSYYSTLQTSPTIKGKGKGPSPQKPAPITHTVKKQTSLPLPRPVGSRGGVHHHRTASNSGESSSNSNSRLQSQARGYPNRDQAQQQQQQQTTDRSAFPSQSQPHSHVHNHNHTHPHSNPNSNSTSLSRQNSNSNTSRSTPSRQNSTTSSTSQSQSKPKPNANLRPHPYAATYVFPSSANVPYAAQAYVPPARTGGPTATTHNNNAAPPTVVLSSPPATAQVHPSSADAAHLAFSPAKHNNTGGGGGGLGFGMGLLRSLKNSISTPDLRASVAAERAAAAEKGTDPTQNQNQSAKQNQKQNAKQPTFMFPKGKERWLSAETWCDAVLFPRPRLKVKQELLLSQSTSATGTPATQPTVTRNMSPPGTPMTPASAFDDDDDEDALANGTGTGRRARKPSARESAIASRVLAYSRSLVDLGKGGGREREPPPGAKGKGVETRPRAQTSAQPPGVRPRYPSHGVPPPPPPQAHVRKERQIPQVLVRPPEQQEGGGGASAGAAGGAGGRPPRPKSWAWDDLALPSPVPSLSHVLREGEMLDAQRAEWQRQAKSSFGNKHSRSLSRNRSRSVTQSKARLRHPGGQHHHQSSLEYLAAQACLGSQHLTPPIAPRPFHFAGAPSQDSSSNGHSHSSSLVKTISKSSQSQGHSRNASWSKGAMKLAKATVVCGPGSISPTSASSSAAQQQQHPAGDLEGALRTQNTKVIRLADPAQLPVDDPASPPAAVRYTPSPAFSALSESKVGIAIGTPPAEATAFGYSLSSHPYAAGGLSISHPAGGNGFSEHEYAGPHPANSNGAGKPAGMSDIAARQNLPPHIGVHPYAQTSSNRDSYIDSNGLIGHYRSDSNVPHTTKMWAQLSPGVVREILPGDIEYSPFMSEDGDRGSPVVSNRNTVMINDTVGVGETLVNAVARLRESKDSGLGTSEGHTGVPGSSKQPVVSSRAPWLHDPELNVLPSFPSMGLRAPNHGPVINLYAPENSADFSEDNQYPHQDVVQLLVAASRDQSNSPAITSESSSPHTSPQPLGSPHDLDGFQDLFYRPSALPADRTPHDHEAALPDTPYAWSGVNVRHHTRTGSGLASLARQLTDEFEQIAQEFRDSGIQYTPRSGTVSATGTAMGSSRGPSTGRHTNGSFPFVFEEPAGDVPSPRAHTIQDSPMQAFKASDTLPEDVLSSRASSFMEPDDDEENTARYRVGMIEPVATPPIMSSEHRLSFAVQPALAHGNTGEQVLLSPLHPPLRSPTDSRHSHSRRQVLSSLQTPTTDATRSSYVTTASDLSRMSDLSAFPVPPKDHDTLSPNASLLSTYFNNDTAMLSSDPNPSGAPGSSAVSMVQEERVTFGRNQNADDLVKTLSSPPRFDPPVPF